MSISANPALQPPRSSTGALMLICGHLNASYVHKVTPDQVAAALRAGSFAAVDETAGAIIGSLFHEIEPCLILRAVRDAGATPRLANQLYQEVLLDYPIRSPQWEEAMALYG